MIKKAMVGRVARICPLVTPLLHSTVLTLAFTSSLQSGNSSAAPAARPPASDQKAFDRGFRSGQAEFNSRQYLHAARIWIDAAGLLPETKKNKENRRAIFEYIAEAYEKAIALNEDIAIMREGLAILDAYAEAFALAYRSDTLPEHVAKTRLLLRTRIEESEAERLLRVHLEEIEAERLRLAQIEELEADRLRREQPPAALPAPPVIAPEPAPQPSRSKKGLAIGGGVALAGGAAMIGTFAAAFVNVKSAESNFDNPMNGCDIDNLTGDCSTFYRQGKTWDRVAVAGLVVGPLLISTGISLLVVANRRKAKRTVLAPTFSSSTLGVVWQRRF